MSETAAAKSNREKFAARMKSKYPDRTFDDDEALFGQINDDYDNYDKEAATYKEHEKAFSDLFTSDPRSASFMTAWRQGGNPAIELVRMFGDDFVDELKDPKKQEEVAKASKEFAERIAKEKEYDEQYKKNLDETIKVVEQTQADLGLSDDDVDAAMSFLVGIMKDGILGKFSRESIEMALKALHHGEDVENATHEGEVRGRNAKIEEKLKKDNRNDGTADLNGKNSGGGAREIPDLGALGRYDNTQDIWQRGGEKRTKYQ